MHNFASGGACPEDSSVIRKIDRIYHKEMVIINNETWAVFSISGDAMLRGQIRKMIGLAIAIARGYVAPRGLDLVCKPGFTSVESREGTISAIVFTITAS
jgi:stage V sporulation protein SpoVS